MTGELGPDGWPLNRLSTRNWGHQTRRSESNHENDGFGYGSERIDMAQMVDERDDESFATMIAREI